MRDAAEPTMSLSSTTITVADPPRRGGRRVALVLSLALGLARADDDLFLAERGPPRRPRRPEAIQDMHRRVSSRPSHRRPLEYDDHHFDHHHRRRVGAERRLSYVEVESRFAPLRVRFDLSNLRPRTTEDLVRVRALTNEILPGVAELYGDLLRVVPLAEPVPVAKESCFGYVDVDDALVRDGAADADLYVFVAGFDEVGGGRLCGEDHGVLAAAAPCELDQHDRPVTGFVNWCLGEIEVRDDGVVSRRVAEKLASVAAHEFAHVLGVNGESWKFFRHPFTGEPLTPRPFLPEPTYECVDGRTHVDVVVPSCHTLRRSASPRDGRAHFEIVTPAVRQVVRNQFDCPTLTGARLENQPTNALDCFGTHWDERYFYTETLSAFYTPGADALSALTLALLEDSGWYRADYSATTMSTTKEERHVRPSPFGRGAGCDFVEADCVVPDPASETGGRVPKYARGYFCADLTRVVERDDGDGRRRSLDYVHTCDPTHTHKAGCDLFDYDDDAVPDRRTSPSSDDAVDDDAPWHRSYFPDGRYGPLYFSHADFCPVAQVDMVDCRRPPDGDEAPSPLPGERYGPDSLCYDARYEGRAVDGGFERTSACLRSRCVASTRALEVTAFGTGETRVCDQDFGTVRFESLKLTVTCPRLSAACPGLSCPANCSGRGACDRAAPFPRCRCFDPTDVSEDCHRTPLPVLNGTDHRCDAPENERRTTRATTTAVAATAAAAAAGLLGLL